MAHPNVVLARRWFEEVWNQRRIETIREMMSEETVCKSEQGAMKGPDCFLEQVYGPMVKTFPDLTITIEGTVAEGDEVVVRWIATGTHTGEGLGMSPTGRRITAHGMTWMRCQDGKVVEGRDCWNQAGVLLTLEKGTAVGSIAME